MMHVIRLRGPWNYQPVARWVRSTEGEWQLMTDALPGGGSVPLPGDWSSALGENFSGSVLFTRAFRCPESLASAARVWLTIEEVEWQATTKLNGQALGNVVGDLLREDAQDQTCPARFDITKLLQPSNLLAITVTSRPQMTDEGQLGYLGLVRLEIEEAGHANE
jgi:hypothetical protein